MACDNNIRKVDSARPETSIIAEAGRVIGGGGIVAFPTTTLYGLAGDAFNRSTADRIRLLKKRPADKPILLLIRERHDLTEMAAAVPDAATRVMDRLWPGMVTLILKAKPGLPAHLPAANGTIALRIPAHPVARALLNACHVPITGTSANISGQPGISRAERINQTMLERPDLILDAGPLKGGAGSTIVDVSVSPPRILREGAIGAEELLAVIHGN